MPNAQFFSCVTRSCRDDLFDLILFMFYLYDDYCWLGAATFSSKTRVIKFTIFLLHGTRLYMISPRVSHFRLITQTVYEYKWHS